MTLLFAVGSLTIGAQTLVFHLAGGAKSTMSLPATVTVTPTGDKLFIAGGGSVVELAKDDVICVTYRGKKGDVNEDERVDVADITSIVNIIVGQSDDNPNTNNTPAGMEAVDLGLPSGTKWANMNVGADSPENDGNHYSWGETQTKDSYTKDNYSYYNSSTWQYIEIANSISGTEYDAAKVNLGNDWKIPTLSQMQELINNCTWEWTQVNGVNGYKVIGPTGNSIFFASGSSSVTGYRYWTGDDAKILYVTPERAYIASQKEYRYVGCLIRPVSSNTNANSRTNH